MECDRDGREPMLAARLHSGRARHPDRPEPRLHQLDRADRAGARVVRGGGPAPPADRRRRRATSASRRPARIGFGVLAWLSRRRAAGDPRRLAGRPWTRPGTAPRHCRPRSRSACSSAVGLVARRVRPRLGPVVELAAVAAAARDAGLRRPRLGRRPAGRPCRSCPAGGGDGAIGGVFAAMILGHWYLVTPKLPEAPLILLARDRCSSIALQVVLFWCWVATGAGPADVGPFAALVGRGRCSSGCA